MSQRVSLSEACHGAPYAEVSEGHIWGAASATPLLCSPRSEEWDVWR